MAGRRLLLPVLLTLAAGPSLAHSLARSGPDTKTMGFERGGRRFELRVRTRQATLRPSLLGQLLLYTVRRNDDFMHPAAPDGGRLLGCVRSASGTHDYLFEVFPGTDVPLGWMLGVGAICGNTSSLLVTLVVPGESDIHPTYRETSFEAKSRPQMRRVGDDLEVWSVRQWWGQGGTASSVFVPERRLVMPAGRVRLAPLDPDWSTWHPSVAGTSFGAAFVAGLEQKNAPLMRRAVLEFLGGDSPDLVLWSQRVGLPPTRQGLLDLADAVADVAHAKARLAKALHVAR